MNRDATPNRYNRQPPGFPVIDKSGIGQGIVSFVAPTEARTLFDYVTGQQTIDPYTGQSFAYTGIKQQGRWRNTVGGAARNTGPISGNLLECTVIHFIRPLALVGTGTSALGQYYSSASYPIGDLQLGDGTNNRLVIGASLGASTQTSSDVDYVPGTFYVVAAACDYSTGTQSIYINGIKQAGVTTRTLVASNADFVLNSSGGTSSSFVYSDSAFCEFYGMMAFNRVLSPSEIASLSSNPWQLFKAPSRTWIPAGVVAATASITNNTNTNISLSSISTSLSSTLGVVGSSGALLSGLLPSITTSITASSNFVSSLSNITINSTSNVGTSIVLNTSLSSVRLGATCSVGVASSTNSTLNLINTNSIVNVGSALVPTATVTTTPNLTSNTSSYINLSDLYSHGTITTLNSIGPCTITIEASATYNILDKISFLYKEIYLFAGVNTIESITNTKQKLRKTRRG